MSEKKPANAKLKPEHTIRCGEVTVIVTRTQSNGGFVYHSFALRHCWQSMATGKESHGSSFFETHEADLLEAIKQAADWIRSKSGNRDGAEPENKAVER